MNSPRVPRLGLSSNDYDQEELLADRIDAVAGLFSRKDRGRLEELRRNGPPEGKSAADVFNDIRVMRSEIATTSPG